MKNFYVKVLICNVLSFVCAFYILLSQFVVSRAVFALILLNKFCTNLVKIMCSAKQQRIAVFLLVVKKYLVLGTLQ